MKSYLIQRAKFTDRENQTGIDSILRFDYMGSAEFEFGALPKSLAKLRSNLKKYIFFDIPLTSDKTITVYCQQKDKEEVVKNIDLILKDKIRLKESCDLQYWLNPSRFKNYNDFYWDIENQFMFWKKNEEFKTKFQTQIKG